MASETERSKVNGAVKLLGESLREVAVLVAVFTPLEVFVQGKSLTVPVAAAMIAGVGAVFVLGVFLEVK